MAFKIFHLSEASDRLESCVRQYSIKQVVLSIPPKHYQTDEFKQLTLDITESFVRKGISVVSEQSNVLQVFCTESGRKTKKKIMRGVVAKFPELRIFYEREMRNKNKYYVKLFEAVGMAALYK